MVWCLVQRNIARATLLGQWGYTTMDGLDGWTRRWWHILGKWLRKKNWERTQKNSLVSQGSRHEVRLFVGGALGDQQVQLHILHICCILLHIINPIAYYVFKCIYAHISDIFTVCMHILGAWPAVWLGIVCMSLLLCEKEWFSVGCRFWIENSRKKANSDWKSG